ncbi:osmoprotectant transport system ATP-binding protein [Chitinophaga costaii]|uniref:Osmoprotectant transport system ATP-binding protein n=1 Tax=Chitinophaga costaii TaxID=1335309 RepID=A0A1C4FPP2_9BACT|nr:ABC transporter ATP-binding protein [Chitinophaga costaii]PUZ29909.1 ABC transporter ATP-binding protein [Chitinophaga costaii]SCC57501.1 osmoprotectant transport system ATP-binding protein [Chitinophaga costaii]
MITLSNVRKQFGDKTILDNISFTVAAGEILVLLGTSGSGKTTLLRSINRLLPLDGGQIMVNNIDIQSLAPELLRRQMGYVLQYHGLFPHYTVAENIALVPQMLGWDAAKIQARVHALLEKLHLSPAEHAAMYPGQLSGGQQQRVGLARALAAQPPILLMDEPFGALDPVTRYHVRREVMALDEIHDKTIVLVTHDVEEAFEMGHRICLLHEGRIQQLGTPAQLLLHPANDFVQSFFAAQRLSLEWKTIGLLDLWPFLPLAAVAANVPEIAAQHSSWEALDFLNNHPGKVINIRNGALHKSVDSAGLLQAIRQYKQA